MKLHGNPVLKTIFVILFIVFPIMGFILGVQYQSTRSSVKIVIPKIYPTTMAIKPTALPTFPVVIFEPPLSNPDHVSQKNELVKKVVEPFIDYNHETYGNDYVVSVLISENQDIGLKEKYPYQLIAVQKHGGAEFTSLMQHNSSLDWWIPVCMDCKFSSSFREKYPEIVKGFLP